MARSWTSRVAATFTAFWFAFALVLPVLGFECPMQHGMHAMPGMSDMVASAASGAASSVSSPGVPSCHEQGKSQGQHHSQPCDCFGCCCAAVVGHALPTERVAVDVHGFAAHPSAWPASALSAALDRANTLPFPTGPPAAVRATA